MLRYRLYEIDRVISRTLVYGALTVILGAAYAGLVLAGQALFSSFAGGSNLAIAASTLVVAALFLPLRVTGAARSSTGASTGAATTPQRTLEAFGARLREQVELERLRADLEGVVRETMQPAHVSLWLRQGAPVSAALRIALVACASSRSRPGERALRRRLDGDVDGLGARRCSARLGGARRASSPRCGRATSSAGSSSRSGSGSGDRPRDDDERRAARAGRDADVGLVVVEWFWIVGFAVLIGEPVLHPDRPAPVARLAARSRRVRVRGARLRGRVASLEEHVQASDTAPIVRTRSASTACPTSRAGSAPG